MVPRAVPLLVAVLNEGHLNDCKGAHQGKGKSIMCSSSPKNLVKHLNTRSVKTLYFGMSLSIFLTRTLHNFQGEPLEISMTSVCFVHPMWLTQLLHYILISSTVGHAKMKKPSFQEYGESASLQGEVVGVFNGADQ